MYDVYFNVKKFDIRLPILVGLLALGVSLSPKPSVIHSQSTDESEIRAVVQKFFEAVQRKDTEVLKSLWSQKSPGHAGTKESSQPTLGALSNVDLSSLSVNGMSVAASESTVWVSARMSNGNSKTDKAAGAPGPTNLTIHLAKEGAAWKVTRWGSSEEELADAIAGAKSDEERKALLDANKGLVSVQLDKALLVLGARLTERGDYLKALGVYEVTRQIAEQNKDGASLAGVPQGIALVMYYKGDYQGALVKYRESLHAYQENGDRGAIAKVLTSIGSVYAVQGGNTEALEYYQKGLDIYLEIGNKKGTLFALGHMGDLELAQGDYSRALESFEKCVTMSQDIGDRQTLASALLAIGRLDLDRGGYPEALSFCSRALEIFVKLDLKPYISDALEVTGGVMVAEGNYPEAIKEYETSLGIRAVLGEKDGIASLFCGIAVAQTHEGNYSQALQHYQRGLHIFDEIGSKSGVAMALNDIGGLYATEGNYPQALQYFRRSLTMASETGNRQIAAGLLGNIAEAEGDRGNYPEARKWYQESLKAAEAIGSTRVISGALEGLGVTELAASNYGQALAYLQRALAIREQLEDKRGIAGILGTLGDVYTAQAEYARAIESEEHAAAIARQIGAPERLIRALTADAKAYRAAGRPELAGKALVEAIGTVEQMRGLVAGAEQDRQGFLEHEIAPYRAMTAILMDQGSHREALAFAEQAKARALIDVLGSGRADLAKALTADEKDREQAVKAQLVSLNAQIVAEKVSKTPDEKRVADLTAQLEKARLEFDDLRTNLYVAHPELKVQRAEFQPTSLAECGVLVPDQNTALLEFAVSDDQTYLFVLTKKNSSQSAPDLTVHKIDIKSKELTDLCTRLYEQLSQHGLDFDPLASKLYSLLLGPAAAELQGRTNLIIVPDGPLWDLPFQALEPARNHYVLEDHAVSYAPSLTALREMSKRARISSSRTGPATTLLAFGNPTLGAETSSEIKEIFMDADLAPLPQAESQVHELGKLYGPAQSKIYTGAEATEDRLKAEAAGARILHIAAHGIVNNASPLYSQIVLARGQGSQDDGLLEAWEVMNMDLKADMVVLAACDTARGRYGAGEGVMGLSWAFFIAGCPTTVVSQWSVEAESTSELMVEFHRNLLSGLSKAEALRRAELKMLKGDARYRNPFYWAPFVVIGTAN
jgi:CHAT domain-containing protein